MIGGKNWFNDVFTSDYESVASKEGYYELMRFWLLGTWMANYLDVEFCFINLVLENRETDIEPIFRKHLKEKPNRQFHRFTWESAYRYVSEQPPVKDTEIMLEYFRDRTIGYDRKGHLLKAFSL